MRKNWIRILTFTLMIAFTSVEGSVLTSFIIELFTAGVLDWFKTLLNKRSTYYF